MRNAREAMELVADRLGEDAAWDDLGRLAVEVEEVFSITLAPSEAGGLRLAAPLGGLLRPLSRARRVALLQANALGAGVEAAAFALDETGRPVLLEEVDCARLDAAALIQKVADFTQLAAWWQTIGSDRLLARTATVAASRHPAAEHMIAI